MFKQKKKLIPYCAAAVLIIILCVSLSFYKNFPLRIFKLPMYAFSIAREHADALWNYRRNYMQRKALRDELDVLRAKISRYNELLLENARLNELLSLKQRSRYKVLAARVIGNSVSNWANLVVVDKGSVNSVKRGAVCVNFLGLVGRVIEVSPGASKVLLANDPNFSVSAIIQRNRTEGLICGSIGSNLIMKYLPKEADIQVSDIIVTSGLSEIFPKGLLIGTVSEVGEDLSGLSRYAIVRPAASLSSLEEILIIID